MEHLIIGRFNDQLLILEGFSWKSTAYDSYSPYLALKGSSDHFERAFQDAYGLPTVISNCSNNYGSFQFPEKLITYVTDRAGHDLRYAIDSTKLKNELGWELSLI